jgi:hypothetical protein
MRRKPHSNRHKRLRAAIRDVRVDPREAVYAKTRIRRRAEPIGFELKKQEDGSLVPEVKWFRYETHTRVLSGGCGRHFYQSTKRAA